MPHIVMPAVEIYTLAGAAVAVWFLSMRLEQTDPMAVGAYAFRPLLIPGLILLWPLVLWRCLVAPAPHRAFRSTHRRIWLVLAIALPALVVGALAIRQNGPMEAPPIRLSAP